MANLDLQRFLNIETGVLRLGDDILLQVCEQLSPEELNALRKTCRYLSTISRSRYLWHRLLDRDVVQQGGTLPSYRKPTGELGSGDLEVLARRALRLDVPCRQPSILRLDMSKRWITWVRLVQGQWMLVASSNSTDSTLTLYSLATKQDGKLDQLSITQLPGPVSSGVVDVQDDRLIIAVCFQKPTRATKVMSVEYRDDSLQFVELRAFNNVSHIRCIRQEQLGCGQYGDSRSPCVINWKTGQVAMLPPTPDGSCLAMALRGDTCIVVSPTAVRIYATSPSAELLQTLQLDHSVAHASITSEYETLPLDERDMPTTRLLLFTASQVGITVLRLCQQDPTTYSVDVVAEDDLKRGDILSSRPSLPHFGGSTARLSWIYAPTSFLDRNASIVTGRLHPRSESTPSKLEILSECKNFSLPSFHTMPVMDYDDGAGLVAIGNACGELAVCNYAGPITDNVVRCYQRIPIPCNDPSLI